jgi:hypothetical protein
MMSDSATSLPIVVLLLFGLVPGSTASGSSYAEIDLGFSDLLGDSEPSSGTNVWDSIFERDDDEIGIGYERFARLATQKARYKTIENLPAERLRVDFSYLANSVDEDLAP